VHEAAFARALKVLAGQSAQDLSAVPLQELATFEPGWQEVHKRQLVAPPGDANVPGGQDRHVETLVALSTAEYEPAGQASQELVSR
jgi:hypothetical protein